MTEGFILHCASALTEYLLWIDFSISLLGNIFLFLIFFTNNCVVHTSNFSLFSPSNVERRNLFLQLKLSPSRLNIAMLLVRPLFFDIHAGLIHFLSVLQSKDFYSRWWNIIWASHQDTLFEWREQMSLCDNVFPINSNKFLNVNELKILTISYFILVSISYSTTFFKLYKLDVPINEYANEILNFSSKMNWFDDEELIFVCVQQSSVISNGIC